MVFRVRWRRLIYCSGLLAARLEGIPLFGFVRGDGKEIVGEHGQGHVSVPGIVLSDLVFVEPDLVLGGAEAFFDGPACTGHVHEFTEPGVSWVVAMVEREFTVVDGSPDQILMVRVGGRYQRPIIDSESFAADAAGATFPRGVVQFPREVLELDFLPGYGIGMQSVLRWLL